MPTPDYILFLILSEIYKKFTGGKGKTNKKEAVVDDIKGTSGAPKVKDLKAKILAIKREDGKVRELLKELETKRGEAPSNTTDEKLASNIVLLESQTLTIRRFLNNALGRAVFRQNFFNSLPSEAEDQKEESQPIREANIKQPEKQQIREANKVQEISLDPPVVSVETTQPPLQNLTLPAPAPAPAPAKKVKKKKKQEKEKQERDSKEEYFEDPKPLELMTLEDVKREQKIAEDLKVETLTAIQNTTDTNTQSQLLDALEAIENRIAGLVTKRVNQLIRTSEIRAKSREKTTRRLIVDLDEKAEEREFTAIEQRGAMMQSLINIEQSFPELKDPGERIRKLIENKADGKTKLNTPGIGLSEANVKKLVKAIPSKYRETLRKPVENLFSASQRMDLNSIMSGLLGFGVIVATGSPEAGMIVANVLPTINSFFGINLNNIMSPPLDDVNIVLSPRYVERLPAQPVVEPIDTNMELQYGAVDDGRETGTPRIEDRKEQKQEVKMEEPRRLPGLSGERIRQAAIGGATAAAIGSAIRGENLAGIIRGIGGGFLAAVANMLTQTQVNNLINYFESSGEKLDDITKQKIETVIDAIPATLVGGVVSKKDVSGITEQMINVDDAIIAETQAKLDQEPGKNRQWAPKQISADPSILGSSRQELYADDVEASLFDYVVPTSEGAVGTIKNNPLKKNQFMNDQLRYVNSGVFVPFEMWSQFTNKQTIDDLAMGQKPIINLPDMKFEKLDQQNTWDNVAKFQYVNRENTSVGMLDPYRNFSNVDNFYTITPDSVLYMENP